MKITVHGIVQGVGFRPTVHRIATDMKLSGYVQNNGSNVIIVVDRDGDEFVRRLKAELPPLARLDAIEIAEGDAKEVGIGFRIIPSQKGQKGVGIPNDAAVCNDCLKDLSDPSNRRFLYPFTNCTNCGARFTVIDDLPYDREKTSMRDFPMCPQCRDEYENPGNRRFHHQTISCPQCGPEYYLLNKEGKFLDGDPVARFAEALESGSIGIAKSWGGMHICSTLDSLPHLRDWYRRKEKPFALMVRGLEAVRRLGTPTSFEEELLLSSHRPVVLIKKKENEYSELISPGLSNIGLFLPYSGMHHLLFHHLQKDVLVMTSANIPGEPMVLRDADALSLGADYYLLHNREIINRCDDSVLRTFEDKTLFIRKSRGHIPSSLKIPFRGNVVGLGAQENLCGAVTNNGQLFPTQYIGDGDSMGVIEFLNSAIEYQRKLLGVDKIQAVAIDLHPAYTNRKLGKKMAWNAGASLVEVQHHWAHAASLLVDAQLESIVALTLDGTGYGSDGKAWGGEVLRSDFSSFDRVAHLQEIPLLGGEMAVRDVRRLVFAISEMLGRSTNYFKDRDAQVLKKIMTSSPQTTSFGRILDALSCYLGICCYRSYDGEPAMKLEKWLERGKKTIDFEVRKEGSSIMTVPMFGQLFESSGKKEDLAFSFVHDLLSAMVESALEEAKRSGIDHIGLTGGVSYNHTITKMTKDLVEMRGMKFVCHDRVPNGDGGISTGQCAIALNELK